MRLLDKSDILKVICSATQRWGILVGFPEQSWHKDLSVKQFLKELKKAAPWFDLENQIHSQAFVDGVAIILCNSERECNKIFEATVGDDGPIYKNKYKGVVRVYCLTCNDKGEPQRENT